MSQLNQNPLTEIPIFDFSGGQASAKRDLTRAANEFKLVNNLIILPQGAGLRSKPGNELFTGTTLDGAVQGLGYYNLASEYLVAVAGGSVYSILLSDGTVTDITGALTITTGKTNRWTLTEFDDLMIGVGANEAPFKWDGSGNAEALGGSPASGQFGFAHANRFFIANGSDLNWSVLGDAEDYSGDGSGSLTAGQGDGTDLTSFAFLNINTVLLFKKTSTYVMSGRTDPFPHFLLFSDIGVANPKAVVVANGLAYFITSEGQMAITDGKALLDTVAVPRLRNVSDILGNISADQLAQVVGTHKRGPDYDWIVWSVTKDGVDENDFAVIWDLNNQCFVTAKTGFEANAFATTPDGRLFMGGFDSEVYECLVEGVYTEASNGGADVAWELQSDALNLRQLYKVIQVARANIAFESRATGTLDFKYGYDSAGTGTTVSIGVTVVGNLWGTMLWGTGVWSGAKAAFGNVLPLGRGNYFRYAVASNSPVDMRINGLTLSGRQQGAKNFGVK
jgi:hypothetical protein